jgi:NADPH2:quinone reductase
LGGQLSLGAWLVHGIELALFIVYELPPSIRVETITATRELLADLHRIAARFPLDRIADAHEAVEGGTLIVNVVVTLD